MAITTTTNNLDDGSVTVIKFAGVTQGDTTPVVEWATYGDRSLQVAGTFAGSTVTLQGSNDGENWATLADPQGNAATFTAAKIEQILEATRYVRCTCATSTGANLTLTLFMRRNSFRA